MVPSRYTVWPGQTIQVDYHEWVENFHSVNISTTLWVLETSQLIDASGVQTVSMTVATVDYWSLNDYRAVAKLMGNVAADRSVELPATGYTSLGVGNPVSLGIQNGQVVSINRVVPISDGMYPPSDVETTLQWIKVKSGVITEIGWTNDAP